MKQPKKRNIPVLVAVITTVLVLAALAVGIVLLQIGGLSDADAGTTAPVLEYDLYWNLDRATHLDQTTTSSSTREKEADGYYHIVFFIDGKTVDLKVAEKQLVNNIDLNDVMGLTFDENGIVVGMNTVWDLPCQVTAWNYYVQSMESNRVLVNSSPLYNGDEQMLIMPEGLKIWDMTGTEGEVGMAVKPSKGDRVIAISNMDGILTHVFVNERKDFMHGVEGYCEHCKETVLWTEYNKTNKLPFSESGHYKLMNDVALTGQQGVSTDKKVCLDLNGFTIDGPKNQRVIALSSDNTQLAIMDSSEAKTGRIIAHNQEENSKQGILLFLHKGDAYFYGGILDASDAITNGTGGAAVYVAADRTFTMNGGEIIGGTAVTALQEKNNTYRYGNGGAVGVMGKFIMNDGVIRDGVAKSASIWKDGKLTYQRGMGGNVYVGTSGKFEMNGGTIKDGKAGTAGNVFLDGAGEFVMNGGTIADGRATDPGREAGNLNFLTKASFTMNGGTISGGSSYGMSGSIYTRGTFTMNGGSIYGGAAYDQKTGKLKEESNSYNMLAQNGANVTITGGRIYGGVLVRDTDEKDKMATYLTLGGSATIWSGEENAKNLSLPTSKEPVKVSVQSLYDSAKIGVNASGIFSLETAERNVDNFVSDVPEADIVYVDKCLAVGKLACLCGSKDETHLGECDGELMLWAPWNTNNNMPSADGNYYLVTDVACTGARNFGSKEKTVNINLDLNGKTFSSAQRAFVAYGNLNIADHTGGGQIIGAGMPDGKDHTGVMIAFAGSRIGIYGGTFKLADKHYSITNAGVLTVAANAEVNFYNGTIDGHSAHLAVEGEGVSTVTHGGAVRLSGTLNLLGGEVYGGEVTTRGGAIYLMDKTSKLHIDGATIHGTTAAQGGSIYVNAGAVTMTSGLITGGTNIGAGSGDHGGNIFVGPNGVFSITGGTVEKGVSLNRNGGNIACRGKLVIGGDAKVLDGTAKTVNSHNIYIQDGEIVLSGNAQINGGVSIASVSETGAKISLSGAVTVANEKTGDYLNLGRTGSNPVPVIQITGALRDGDKKANITVKSATGSGVFAQGADYTLTAEDAACFTTKDTGLKVKLEKDNTLILMEKDAAGTELRCLCKTGDKPWCDHAKETWQAWDGKTQLKDGKNYYLTKDVTDAKEIELAGVTVKLDLNGHSYTSKNRVFKINTNSTLHIVDSSYSTGTLIGNGSTPKNNGGVLHVLNSTLNLYSGTYALAQEHNEVGNGGVIVVGGTSTVNIHGGTIGTETSGNAIAQGGAINFGGSALNIYGGTIKANNVVSGNGSGICMTAGTVTVGGDAVIENIYLPIGNVIAIDESFDTEKASVTVDMESAGIFAQGADGFVLTDAVMERFASTNAEDILTLDTAQNVLVMGQQSAPQFELRCLCKTGDKPWCDHTKETWLPWDGTGRLQSGNNYYLTEDVTDAREIELAGVTVKLDLNGHSYTSKYRVFKINTNSTLHIVDSSYSTGTLIGNGATPKNNGGVLHVVNSTLNIYSGNYALGQNHNEIGNGGVIVVGGTSTVNIHGGTIGTETSGNAIAQGGAINFGGSALNIYGGTIKANNVVSGNGSGICMTAGTVTVGGDAVIENIYLPTDKVITIDQSIDTDKASITVDVQTAGVFAQGADNFTLTDAVKTRFESVNDAHIIELDAQRNALVVSEHVVNQPTTRCLCKTGDKPWCDHTQQTWLPWDGTGKLQSGNNYYLTEDVTDAKEIELAGVTVKLDLNGHFYTSKNRVFKINTNSTLHIVDSSYSTGTLIGNGATPKNNGGVLHVVNSTLNIYSGNYALGQNHNEIGNGGVIVVGGTSTVNIHGGTIGTETSGNAIAQGGAINFGGTALNIYGGTIKANNVVSGNGSGICMTAGTVTVGGDAVIENIYLPTDKVITIDQSIDTDEANITVAMQTAGVFARPGSGLTLTDEVKNCFVAANKTDYMVALQTDALALVENTGEPPAASNCLCGSTEHETWCTKTAPVAWTGSGLPTATGNYYLSAPVKLTEKVVIPEGVRIKLWLEGNDITVQPGKSVGYMFEINKGGMLTLTDSTNDPGTVDGLVTDPQDSNVVGKVTTRIVECMGTLILDGANLDASGLTIAMDGLAVRVVNNTAEDSIFVMKNGTITGGIADGKLGGCVYVQGKSSMRMEGGTMTSGVAKQGGNLAAQGTVVITGGSILDGAYQSGGRGGNIHTQGNPLRISGNTTNISGGYQVGDAAKTLKDRSNVVCWDGNLVLEDVTMEGGIWITGNRSCTLEGTVVVNGDGVGLTLGATSNGGATARVVAGENLNAASTVDLAIAAWVAKSGKIYASGLTAAQADMFTVHTANVIKRQESGKNTWEIVYP